MKILTSLNSLSGHEISILDGDVHLWLSHGCYTVEAHPTVRGGHNEQTTVTLDIMDTKTGQTKELAEIYDDTFDDFEIIHRYVFGALSCDCRRGKFFYNCKSKFRCNSTINRFVLRRMTISGLGGLRCVVLYRKFI